MVEINLRSNELLTANERYWLIYSQIEYLSLVANNLLVNRAEISFRCFDRPWQLIIHGFLLSNYRLKRLFTDKLSYSELRGLSDAKENTWKVKCDRDFIHLHVLGTITFWTMIRLSTYEMKRRINKQIERGDFFLLLSSLEKIVP